MVQCVFNASLGLLVAPEEDKNWTGTFILDRFVLLLLILRQIYGSEISDLWFIPDETIKGYSGTDYIKKVYFCQLLLKSKSWSSPSSHSESSRQKLALCPSATLVPFRLNRS